MFFRSLHTLLSLFIFINTFCFAQKRENNNVISYSELNHKIDSLDTNPKAQWKYISNYIDKAKKEKDLENLRKGYILASFNKRGEIQLKYSDSIVIISKKIGGNNLIGDSYLTLGMSYYANEEYQAALRSYLEGYKYIKKGNDPYLLYNIQYQIANVKNYLGLYHEANNLLENTVSFFRIHNENISNTDYKYYYIYSLLAYINNNFYLGRINKNEKLIEEGKTFIRQNKTYQEFYPYFIAAEGRVLFYEKKYTQAIDKIEDALILYNDNWGHFTDKFYIGTCFWKLNKKNEAAPYFLILDKEYNTTKKLDPLFRPAFEMLLTYYSEQNNYKKQLEYVNKLIALDKIYEKDYKYLYKTLDKEYDTKRLNEEKSALEKSIIWQEIINTFKFLLGIILILSLIYFSWKYLFRKKYYSKEIKLIVKKTDENDQETKPEAVYNDLEINPITVANILNELSVFEKNKTYLKKNITLSSLAKKCGTNTSYLSKIINHYKEQSFAEYLNDLRLNQIVNNWKTHPKSRYLSLQETAEKAGYNSTQAFAKNFQEKYKITPSAYLSSLENNKIS